MPGEPLTYNQFTQKSLPYDPVKSFEPVTNLFFITQALGVSAEARREDARRARRLFEGEGRHAVLFGAVVVAGLLHGELEEEDRRRPGARAVQGRRRHRHQHAVRRDAGRLPRARQLPVLHPAPDRSTPILVDADKRVAVHPGGRRRSARWASRATTPAPSSGCWRRPARRRRSPSGSARRSSRSPASRRSCSATSSTAGSSRCSIRRRNIREFLVADRVRSEQHRQGQSRAVMPQSGAVEPLRLLRRP